MEEKSVMFEIKTLQQLIFRNFFLNLLDDSFEKNMPTPTQMRIIDYLLSNNFNTVYQKDLEKEFNLRRATISGVLKTMEKNHLIIRKPSKNDSRTKEISLSDNTKIIFQNNIKRLKKIENIIKEGINEDDMYVFFKVIGNMKENIKSI